MMADSPRNLSDLRIGAGENQRLGAVGARRLPPLDDHIDRRLGAVCFGDATARGEGVDGVSRLAVAQGADRFARPNIVLANDRVDASGLDSPGDQ